MRGSAVLNWAVFRDPMRFWGCCVWGAFVGRYEGWAGAKGIVGVWRQNQEGKDGELCGVVRGHMIAQFAVMGQRSARTVMSTVRRTGREILLASGIMQGGRRGALE